MACVFIRWVGAKTRAQHLAVGLEWAALTLLFEAGVGRLAMGLSGEQLWARMREDYGPSVGGLMAFGLGFLAASPWLAWRLRQPVSGPGANDRPAC